MKKALFILIHITSAVLSLHAASKDIYSRPDIIKEVEPDLHYGVSMRNGFLKSVDGGISWTPYNQGLPARMVYPFTDTGVKMLTSVTYDVEDYNRIMVSSPREIFLSDNGGTSWNEVPLKYPFKYSNYITSLALNPLDKSSIVVGTSFSGIYETKDRGASWSRISEALPELYRGAGFYEEITAVALSPMENGVLYYLCGPTGELYYSAQNRQTWINIDLPFGEEERALSMHFARSSDQNSPDAPTFVLQINTDRNTWVYNPQRNWWWKKNIPGTAVYTPDAGKMIRLEKAAGKYGIYISSWHASGERLDKLLQFVLHNNMNSIVVDMKDDDGYITYDSHFPEAEKTGAITPRFSISELLEKAHAKGIYVIARLPVFKDKVLYGFDHGRYALKDKNSGGTWGKKFEVEDEETGEISLEQREFWVDPYSEYVWDYNVGIAEELQDLGVDEIQFDYIRFPTDGDLSAIDYSYARPGMLRIEALESFLVMARDKIHIPLSTDLYGFNSWYRMGNWNGQNIEMVSHYVDVISPMYYPSHFPEEFLSEMTYLDRAEEIYKEGSRRSSLFAGKRSLIRPYVQAFLMGPELKMEDDEYTTYLNRQVKGVQESSTSGFSLWNASNRYYMVSNGFTKIFKENP